MVVRWPLAQGGTCQGVTLGSHSECQRQSLCVVLPFQDHLTSDEVLFKLGSVVSATAAEEEG